MLKVEDLAKVFDCNKETIRRYVRTGKLKARKIGKRYWVSRENLKAFTNGVTSTRK